MIIFELLSLLLLLLTNSRIQVRVVMMTNAKHMVLSHVDDNFFFLAVGILYFPKEFTCDKAKKLMISTQS